MIAFANCKINLGLHVLQKRKDGFHNIETCFYPIAWNDIVEITKHNDDATGVKLAISGLPVGGEQKDNLCIKAYDLLKNDFPHLPCVKMHLHKVIPPGAGLGGGSSDAAFTLQLLNNMFRLSLSVSQLLEYALVLGSDCPFFIINKPCYATGRGEIMEEISLNLSEYTFVLVNPGIHIATNWAFSQVTPAFTEKSIQKILQQPVYTWKEELVNDFEIPVFKKYPAIKHIKDELYQQGAVFAALSGTGSTVFGLFKDKIPSIFFSDEQYLIHRVHEQIPS